MTHGAAPFMHKCTCCKYQTRRRFDLKRHQNAMHKSEIYNDISNENKDIPNGENVFRY